MLTLSKTIYLILFSLFDYFKRYGDQGTKGRKGVTSSRGGWNQQEERHTAKNDFNNVY